MALHKITRPGSSPTTLTRTIHPITPEVALWVAIRNSCRQLDFHNYKLFIDDVMTAGSMQRRELTKARPSDPQDPTDDETVLRDYQNAVERDAMHVDDEGDPRYSLLPFSGSDRYALLKAATEVFVMAKCGVDLSPGEFARMIRAVSQDVEMQGHGIDFSQITTAMWQAYLDKVDLPGSTILPYYGLILDKIRDVQVAPAHRELTTTAYRLLRQKLTHPCFLELMWCYWHEEGMLVQTMNAILLRFQNVRLSDRDPLANMEIDPLRPLNNMLWGLIQDEQNRLTVHRRAYEYNHQYGLGLVGKAVPHFRPADTRSKFIEAFHHLLYRCSLFYKEDDDTTIVADGFPVLNALKEVHIILTEGSHNQYGDLPTTARQEMLMQEWILARPEMREFLPTRLMVAYAEPWMDRVDAMKKVQGWSETSVYHFHDLGVFGEQLLLAIRFGDWSKAFNGEQGANWARFWRAEAQGYLHAYRAVTGVDLSAESTSVEHASARMLPPSVLLQRRLAQQIQRALPQPMGRTLFPQGARALAAGDDPDRR
jgi:hypothetical protein